MNVELDVGPNITSMLERLAEQLGTTADKVFPWYVNQAQIEGLTTLIGIAAFLVMSAAVFCAMAWKADYQKGNVPAIVSIPAGIILFFSVLAVPAEGIDAVRKMMNPNYYAMTMLTKDIGRMVKK